MPSPQWAGAFEGGQGGTNSCVTVQDRRRPRQVDGVRLDRSSPLSRRRGAAALGSRNKLPEQRSAATAQCKFTPRNADTATLEAMMERGELPGALQRFAPRSLGISDEVELLRRGYRRALHGQATVCLRPCTELIVPYS